MEEFICSLFNSPEQIKILLSIGFGVLSLIKLRQTRAIDTYVVSESQTHKPIPATAQPHPQPVPPSQEPSQQKQKSPSLVTPSSLTQCRREDHLTKEKELPINITMEEYVKMLQKSNEERQRKKFSKIFFFEAEKMTKCEKMKKINKVLPEGKKELKSQATTYKFVWRISRKKLFRPRAQKELIWMKKQLERKNMNKGQIHSQRKVFHNLNWIWETQNKKKRALVSIIKYINKGQKLCRTNIKDLGIIDRKQTFRNLNLLYELCTF